jgi:hypothetical protein
MAIAIILFYFRGALNFYEKSKTIKMLAYVWIAQNVFMILSTMYRNNVYVTEYGLTYKRIGVYVYLLLTCAGLITTFIKIAKVKTNAYLFRVNGWIFYSVLIIAAFINWDRFIAEVNITKAKQVQTDYLLDLSYTVLPKLYTYHNHPLDANTFGYKTSGFALNNFNRRRDKQLYYFLLNHQQLSWKSWYYDENKTYKELIQDQRITELDLASMNITSVNPLGELRNIEIFNLMGNFLYDTNELSSFRRLKQLNICKNQLVNINGLEYLGNLEMLDIRQNKINDYSPLFKLKNLKTVYVDDKITEVQYQLLKNNLPTTTIIKS